MDRLRLLKIKEFKGDALAKFLSTLIFNSYLDVIATCSNNNLGITGMKLELEPIYDGVRYSNEKTDPRTKAFANAYEVRLWEVYEELGLREALDFFKVTALANYIEGKEAIQEQELEAV